MPVSKLIERVKWGHTLLWQQEAVAEHQLGDILGGRGRHMQIWWMLRLR